MTHKDIIIDFVNLVFGLILISSSIIYFSTGNNFEEAKTFFMFLMLISLPLLFIAIRIKISKKQIKKKKREKDIAIVLKLTYYDKLKMDIIILSVPIIMLSVTYAINKDINFTNILQSIIIVIMLWYAEKIIFKS